MERWNIEWQAIQALPSRSYICGYCNMPLASEKGWYARTGNQNIAWVYICHHCKSPTFFDPTLNQTPGPIFGNPVSEINDKPLEDLYNEARKASGAGSYTAAILCCRKILMHIAVSKGALPGEAFIKYVEFLSDNNYVPPDAKDWVDHIRKKGNEANHDVVIMSQDDAQELLGFIEMLLKIIYEFPATIKKKI